MGIKMSVLILCFFILLIIILIKYLNVHPFISLLGVGLMFGITMGMGFEKSFETLIDGFANTIEWIGVVIILGAVIGEILAETGAALLIANSVIQIFGEKRITSVMAFTGYLVGIPVFVDVAYVMMKSIIDSIAIKSKKNILVIGLSLVAGLTATHALLPPTPGPLAGAALLNANLGKVIVVNLFVALFAVIGGIIWVNIYCKSKQLPYDLELLKKNENYSRKIPEQKSFKFSLLAISPIILPLILISIGSFTNTKFFLTENNFLKVLGNPTIALFIGLLTASFLLPRKKITEHLSRILDRSIEKIAVILMITAAGGAFGAVIKAAGIGESVANTITNLGIPALLLPFLLALGLTTSTGSITVSIVTASSIISSLINSLGISPEMALALIAAGSLSVIHTNSSFFWLFSKMHDVPVTIMLKSLSIQTFIMSLCGLLAALFLHTIGFV